MHLMDKSLSSKEERNELSMLEGNIARIMVSNDIKEIISSLGFASDRLHTLAYSRINSLLHTQEEVGELND